MENLAPVLRSSLAVADASHKSPSIRCAAMPGRSKKPPYQSKALAAPLGDALSASKLAAFGVLVGCLIAAGFVLFLLMSAPEPAPENNAESPSQAITIPATRTSDTVDAGKAKNKTPGDPTLDQAKRPKVNRSRRRGSAGPQSSSKYKNALVLSGGGKPPKMMQPQ